MDSMPIRLSAVEISPTTRRAVLWWAAVVALAMFSFYIHILHEGVARGERVREAMRSTARSAPAMAPAAPTITVTARPLRTARAGG